MATNKKYFHDRLVLLFLSVESFLTLLSVVLILIKLSTVRGKVTFVTQFRSQPNAIDFVTGGIGINGTVWDILSFVFAVVGFFAIGAVLSYKVYKINRALALTVLALTFVLLIFSIAVSNILLILR